MSEVAARAGVSAATVSRVLNERPGVSPATRQRVLAAVDMLGYQRPETLQSRAARAVAIVVPDFVNPWYGRLVELLAGALADRGWAAVVRSSHTRAGGSEERFVPTLLTSRVGGVIFAGGDYQDADRGQAHYASLSARGLPTVLVNGHGCGIGFPTVSTDDRVSAELAWQHLRQLGHDEVGLVLGHHGHLGSRVLVDTVRELSRTAGHRFDEQRIAFTDSRMESGQAVAGVLFDRGATGLICANDYLALGACRAIARRGAELGPELAVVGYDGSPAMSLLGRPLTTVRQPVERLADEAVRLLFDHAAEGHSPDILLVPELSVGASTGVRRR